MYSFLPSPHPQKAASRPRFSEVMPLVDWGWQQASELLRVGAGSVTLPPPLPLGGAQPSSGAAAAMLHQTYSTASSIATGIEGGNNTSPHQGALRFLPQTKGKGAQGG